MTFRVSCPTAYKERYLTYPLHEEVQKINLFFADREKKILLHCGAKKKGTVGEAESPQKTGSLRAINPTTGNSSSVWFLVFLVEP